MGRDKDKIFTIPVRKVTGNSNHNSTADNPTNFTKEELISKAFHFHSQGNISEASKYYQIFINNGFNDPRVFSNFGLICQQKGNTELAIKLYRKSIKLFANNPNAYSNLANSLKNIGQVSEAEQLLRKAIELNPTFSVAYCNLGILLQEIGKLNEAEEFTLKAIKYNSNSAIAYSNLGSILCDLGRLNEAEIATKKAISIDPNQARFYSMLSQIMLDSGRFQEAEVQIRKSISFGSVSITSYLIFGKLLFLQDKKEQAIKEIIKALEINPNNKKLALLLSSITANYHSQSNSEYYLIKANKEFAKINILTRNTSVIYDNDIKEIYLNALNIYNKYQLRIETNLSQIYKNNDIFLNCSRHKYLFDQYDVIPEFCFSCYKVQIEPKTLIDLIKIYILFEELELENNNSRKTMIELRQGLKGFYKGLIYCSSLEEAKQVSLRLDNSVAKTLTKDLRSTIKHGCSEYSIKYPNYKYIGDSQNQPMQYDSNWKIIEQTLDQENRYWGQTHKSIIGLNLNKFLIIRNWISYAQRIGDLSVKLLTEDNSIGDPKIFSGLDLKNITDL